jgi:gamma-glutamyltranspeptidase
MELNSVILKAPIWDRVGRNNIPVEDRISKEVRDALIERGHKLTVSGPWVMGSNGTIFVDHKAHALSAGADPRVEAYALAW